MCRPGLGHRQNIHDKCLCSSFLPGVFPAGWQGPFSLVGTDIDKRVLPLKKLLVSYLQDILSQDFKNESDFTSTHLQLLLQMRKEQSSECRWFVLNPADTRIKYASFVLMHHMPSIGHILLHDLLLICGCSRTVWVCLKTNGEVSWTEYIFLASWNWIFLISKKTKKVWPIYCADLKHNFIDLLKLKVPSDLFKFWELKNIWPRFKWLISFPNFACEIKEDTGRLAHPLCLEWSL